MNNNVEKQNFRTDYASRNDTRESLLIARISRGDENAMEALYRHYYERLFRFVFRTTQSVETIEEVINDVMLVIWNKAATFNGSCRPSTWIFGIAYNKARKVYATRSQPVFVDADVSKLINQPVSEAAKDWVAQVELQNWLETGLAQLSPEQRAVVELTHFNGMHYAEIAKIVGCPENTVKTRMFHARKNLSSVLEKLNGN